VLEDEARSMKQDERLLEAYFGIEAAVAEA
jgi:hypothetical protein